jgi:CHAD domain-containing protein
MTQIEANKTIVADYVYAALQSQYVAILTYEADAIAAKDPEAIHQMRVNLRKLRSTVNACDSILNLPKIWNDLNLRKIAKTLGRLRDCDVLIETCDRYRSDLPTNERKMLDEAIIILSHRRRKALARVKYDLESKNYYHLKLAINNWLNQPEYTATGDVALLDILPDLLLQPISKLFCHSAWWLDIDGDRIDLLTESAENLHDLRKQIKYVRYSLSLFNDLEDSWYHEFMTDLKQGQKLLGNIQDCLLLEKFLLKNIGKKFNLKLPSLREIIDRDCINNWQGWEPIQQRYRNRDIKRNLQIAILQ